MSGRNVNFRDKEIKISNFYKNKNVIQIVIIDANKILASKEAYVRKFEGNTTNIQCLFRLATNNC